MLLVLRSKRSTKVDKVLRKENWKVSERCRKEKRGEGNKKKEEKIEEKRGKKEGKKKGKREKKKKGEV